MASPRARSLRTHPTDAERAVWTALRRQQLDGHRFRRRHPFGPYVVDFVCLAQKLAAEVDGGQHAAERDRDAQRTAWLEARGYRVLRFWNNEVLENPDGVIEVIRAALLRHPPP